MIGRTLSHYRILDRLGEGGMGEVFLAQDLRLERPVAIKLLSRAELSDAEARARLLAEARAASALNHPAIAVVYAVEEAATDAGPLAFLAMEYVAGEAIDRWVRAKRPALDELVAIAAAIAEGLAAAHGHGIVHRDIKPSNLLVTASGQPKILDFGVATWSAAAAAAATTDLEAPPRAAAAIAGSLAYMAPEQLRGEPVGPSADVYSLGIVIAEMLAGERPHAGASARALLSAWLEASEPAGAAAADRRALDPLATLVSAMVARDPKARPPGMAAVGAALAAARTAPAPTEVPDDDRSVVVLPFDNISGHPEDAWLSSGIAETVAAELARLTHLRVVGRERVEAALRRAGLDPRMPSAQAFARLSALLPARYLAGGSFQRQGDTVRATVRLAEAATGATLVSSRLDGTLADIFELQDRVARELVRHFDRAARPMREDGGTAVVAAYEAFAKGLLNLRSESYEGLYRAILLFERAVALDPGYARAELELGAARGQLADYLVAPELYEQALASLRAVVVARPGWARAERELGVVLVSMGRDEEGLVALERASALAPHDARVLAGLARGLFLGRADFAGAAKLFARALERQPDAGWYWLQLAHCHTMARDLAAAGEAAARAIDLQERYLSGRDGQTIVGAYMRRAHIAALSGDAETAARACEQELAFLAQVDHALRGRIQVELHLRLGCAQRALGRAEAAQASLATAVSAFERRVALGAGDPFTRYYAAATYGLLGDRERALAELAQCAAERPQLTRARARLEPEWLDLRDDPRFRELVGA